MPQQKVAGGLAIGIVPSVAIVVDDTVPDFQAFLLQCGLRHSVFLIDRQSGS
jgi:hypothetical protein